MNSIKWLSLGGLAITVSACLGGNSATTSNEVTVRAAAKSVTATANYQRGSVSNWPNYIAMGTITNNGYFVGANSEHGLDNPTDAVFKYAGSNGAGDMGQIIFPQTTYRTIYEARQYSAATGRLSRPVMVEYTLQLSGGDNGMVDLSANNMAYHFINLATDAYLMEVNGDQNGYGSIVLNPDALGFLQQNYSNVKGSMARTYPVTQQLKASICYLTTPVSYSLTWSNTGQTVKYVGTPLQILQSITDQSKGTWIMSDSYSDWASKAAGWYSSCAANPVIPSDFVVPTFNDTFTGWIQATNWLIKKFGPNVTYGWHENISMLPSGSLWVGNYNAYDSGTASAIQNNVTNPTLEFLNTYQVFNGSYRPDFIVFDRYEVDDTQNSMYFYEDSDWSNFFTFVGQTSRGLNNIPVMLWQMPGGHIQSKNDVDQRGSHGGTFTNYLFGDSDLVLGTSCATSNLQSYWCGFYNTITAHNYKWNQDNGKLALAAQYNVFAILFGGGTGPTTGINGMGTYDGGWLANKVVNYYKNPQPVVIITPLPTPTVSPTPIPSPTPTVVSVGDCGGLDLWSASTAYQGGAIVYKDTTTYKANYWSQNSDPASHSGAYQEWAKTGSCPTTTPAPSPTPSATPSPKPTVSPSPSPVPSPSPSVVPSPSPSPVPTVSPSPVPTQSPTPAPAKTGTVTITMPTVVSAYNGNLQVQLLNSKDSNAVVATYTVKQGASVSSGNLPISDSTHAYKVKLVSGIADPLNGVNYIESGTPTVAVKNGQNTAMTIPMKASTTTLRTVTLAISGLQGNDKANISFSDANGKYSYTGYSGYGNGNAVFKIENNQSLTITVATAGGSYQSSSLSNSSTISKNQTIAMAFTAKVQPSPSPVPTVAPSPSPVPSPSPSPSVVPSPSPSPIASPTPAPSPSPSGVQCSSYSTWNSGTAYIGGDMVSYGGYVYKANWWTKGNNPSTNNGGPGSGEEWLKIQACQ